MDFTIRNLPAPVLEDLERSARLNGRSVNDEAIARLAPAAATDRDVTAELAEIDRLRSSLSVPPLTAEYRERAVDRHGDRGSGLSAKEPALGCAVRARSSAPIGTRRPVHQILADIDEMRKRHPLPELTPELLDELKREGRA